MGEHRDHPVCKIYAGSPLQRLPVKGAAFLNIICHVGDVHAEPVVLPFFRQGNGIIQVFRILAVDGHHGPAPEIFPPRAVRFAHFFPHTDRLVEDPLREFRGDPHVHNDGQNVCPRVIYMADDLRHLALRLHVRLAIGGQLHHHFMPGHGALFFPRRDIDIIHIPLVIRPDEPEPLAPLIEADDPHDIVREDPDDLPLFSPARRRPCDNVFHLIPVERTAEIFLGNIYIPALILRADKAEAPCIGLENAFQPDCLSPAVLPSFGQGDLPVVHERVKHRLQVIPLLTGDLEHCRNLPDLHRDVQIVTDEIQHHFFPFFKCLIHSGTSFSYAEKNISTLYPHRVLTCIIF